MTLLNPRDYPANGTNYLRAPENRPPAPCFRLFLLSIREMSFVSSDINVKEIACAADGPVYIWDTKKIKRYPKTVF
jgi:hypothetical protein